jgi:hypothetical protein
MKTLHSLSFIATVAACLAFAPVAPAQAPEPTLVPSYTLVPREGKGLGTLSAYGGVVTAFAPDAAGVDGIDIPNTGKKEVNLIWTFWRHKQPASEAWPAGPDVRSSFTLLSETGATLSFRVGLRVSGQWTEMIPASELTLDAGKPAVVTLALPASVPVGSVEVVRVQITSPVSIPALRVTDWSIGELK